MHPLSLLFLIWIQVPSLLTAAFHVVFDDWFATVPAASGEPPSFDSAEWTQLFGDSMYQYVCDDGDLLETSDLDHANGVNDQQDTVG
jgi:hypothetical protein